MDCAFGNWSGTRKLFIRRTTRRKPLPQIKSTQKPRVQFTSDELTVIAGSVQSRVNSSFLRYDSLRIRCSPYLFHKFQRQEWSRRQNFSIANSQRNLQSICSQNVFWGRRASYPPTHQLLKILNAHQHKLRMHLYRIPLPTLMCSEKPQLTDRPRIIIVQTEVSNVKKKKREYCMIEFVLSRRANLLIEKGPM